MSREFSAGTLNVRVTQENLANPQDIGAVIAGQDRVDGL